MGHVISSDGIRTDPEKVRAISDFPQPIYLTEVRRFLVMVQYLSRYISNLTEDLHPIQNLTKKMFHSFGQKVRKTLFWPPKQIACPHSLTPRLTTHI
ncbi:reverse ribonuclease integrase [Plakobranchus ocellatus]|uniref:Reverse ribonuclease integrase n=1 Tax=Plakobranchus ocellatus TaxID=259542 RepID=A0AAV4DMS0_9GAST|nr:reverse ribonuclease integrase [Plakobranchus ocellatus]